jgi:hypothetical protein
MKTVAAKQRTNRQSEPSESETAVIYLRVSSKDQLKRGGLVEGFSIPEQRADCQAKAQLMGVKVLREYTEKGESAKTANHHELQKMLLFIAEHKPTCLIPGKAARGAIRRGLSIQEIADHYGYSAQMAQMRINRSGASRLRPRVVQASFS